MYLLKSSMNGTTVFKTAGSRAVRFTIIKEAFFITIFFCLLLSAVAAHSEMNWKKADTPSDLSPRAGHGMLSYDNKLWIFSGTSSKTSTNALSTSDGTNWTKLSDTAGFKIGGYYGYAVFKNSMWIIGGQEIGGG